MLVKWNNIYFLQFLLYMLSLGTIKTFEGTQIRYKSCSAELVLCQFIVEAVQPTFLPLLGGHHFLDFSDSLPWIQRLGTGPCAVHDGVTAVQRMGPASWPGAPLWIPLWSWSFNWYRGSDAIENSIGCHTFLKERPARSEKRERADKKRSQRQEEEGENGRLIEQAHMIWPGEAHGRVSSWRWQGAKVGEWPAER